MKKELAVITAAVAAAVSAFSAERIIHIDEMDHLAQITDALNKGAEVAESRCNITCARFTGAKGTDYNKTFFKFSESPKEKKWTVFFKFFLPRDTREFGFKLYFGDPAKPESRLLTIREEGSFFEGGAKPMAPKEGDAGFNTGYGEMAFGSWQTAAISVEGNQATFWVPRGGKLVADARGSLPAKPLVGWNVSATADGTCVGFDRIILVDGAARSCERGDLQELLPEIAKATRGSWDASFGSPMVSGTPVSVDFTKQQFEAQFRSSFANDKSDAVTFSLQTADGKSSDIKFASASHGGEVSYKVYKDGKFVNAPARAVATNGVLSISGDRVGFHFVPPFDHWGVYETAEINAIFANRDLFPKPAESIFRFRVMAAGEPNTYRLLLGNQMFRLLKTEAPVTAVVFLGGDSAESRASVTPVAFNGPETWNLALPKAGFKLERIRENLGSYALECSGYLSRDAMMGMPSSCLWNVPRKQWYKARAVCTIDPTAPKEFVPVITARLTQFDRSGGRSIAMAQTTIDLSKDDPRVTRKGGEYVVDFDLDVASIMDLTSMVDGLGGCELPYLHFEFLGPLWEKNRYYIDSGRSPAEELRSSVVVKEASLIESPVFFKVESGHPFALYYPGQVPTAKVTARALDGTTHKVSVEVFEEGGKSIWKDSFTVSGSMEKTISFPKDGPLGYYKVVYDVTDSKGAAEQHFESAYGLLPKNTREAGYDSKFYSWNFNGAHGTVAGIENWSPSYNMLGVKRTLFGAKDCETNAALKASNFTHAQFPYIKVGESQEDAEKAKERMRDYVRRFPHCKEALIFHESGGGPFPKEVYGEKTELSEGNLKRQKAQVEMAIRTAKAWREVDPSVKMLIGNSGESYGIISALMRGGFPKEYADSWGEESVGLTIPPEMTTALYPWMIKKLARIYGYTELMDAPFEWKDRTERYERSFRGAAAICTRDALIAFALGYKTIPVNCSTEIANSYADTIWCSGTFARWPLAFPRENALAIATLTLLLDKAEFVRQVETGSLTAYALEFKGKKGEWIYALWTSRGETAAEVTWNGKADCEHVSMTGARTKFTGESLGIGDEPVYLVSRKRIESVSVAPGRTFKYEDPALNASNRTVTVFTQDSVTVEEGENISVDQKFEEMPLRPGKFAVRDVDDAEKGKCLEVEHLSQEKCPEFMQEYCFIRLKEPKTIEGEFDTIGIWAKGNSNWGKVVFEIADAEGEVWSTTGIGGLGCYTYDWPSKLSFNYDGWNFLQVPVTSASNVRIVGPGENKWMWTRDCTGNGKIDWPVKVTGIGVTQFGSTLDILEMKKGSPVIRLGEIQVR